MLYAKGEVPRSNARKGSRSTKIKHESSPQFVAVRQITAETMVRTAWHDVVIPNPWIASLRWVELGCCGELP